MNALLTNEMVGYYGARREGKGMELARRLWAGEAGKVAMMLAGPALGLVFVVAAPFAGLAVLAWLGARRALRAAAPAGRHLVNVALFLAAPFIGLAYAAAFPFIGIAMLVVHAVRGAAKTAPEAA
jgi:hypothetical protein